MDEITIDGKTYLSSKRAAAITGYAKDYVGQLCREGRVEARLVGRSWYVYEPSIREHRFGNEASDKGIEEAKAGEAVEESSELPSVYADWQPVYQPESAPSLPIREAGPEAVLKSENAAPLPASGPQVTPLEDLEESWKSWFSSSAAEEKPQEDEESVLEPQKEPQGPRYSPREEVSREEMVEIARIKEEAPIAPVPAYEAPLSRRQPREFRPSKARRAPRRRSYAIEKAILGGVMVLSAAVALIGAGFAENITGSFAQQIPAVEFIQGVTHIK